MTQLAPITTLLACKVLGLTPGLSSSARQVGCAIVDHFNRNTSQCDPSIPRLARLLGLDRRTVLRAIDELDRRNLIARVRHGGSSQRNRYVPNWPRFLELSANWNSGMKEGKVVNET